MGIIRGVKIFLKFGTAKEAIIWLIEKKLKCNAEDVKKKLAVNTFSENFLYSVLNYLFNINL